MQSLFSSVHLLILGMEEETENSGKGIEEMIATKSRKSSKAFHSFKDKIRDFEVRVLCKKRGRKLIPILHWIFLKTFAKFSGCAGMEARGQIKIPESRANVSVITQC